MNRRTWLTALSGLTGLGSSNRRRGDGEYGCRRMCRRNAKIAKKPAWNAYRIALTCSPKEKPSKAACNRASTAPISAPPVVRSRHDVGRRVPPSPPPAPRPATDARTGVRET